MAVEYNQNSYTTPTQILVFPDHYVAKAQNFAKDHSLSVVVEGRDIVKAGTIFPANDETAEGIVFTDLDVTDGDKVGAILLHAFVKTSALPEAPTDAARRQLKGIYFLPSVALPTEVTQEITDHVDAAITEAGIGDLVDAAILAAGISTLVGNAITAANIAGAVSAAITAADIS